MSVQDTQSTYQWGCCIIFLACQMEAVCSCPGPQLGWLESRWGDSPYSRNGTKRNIMITRGITANQHEGRYVSPSTERTAIPPSSAHYKCLYSLRVTTTNIRELSDMKNAIQSACTHTLWQPQCLGWTTGWSTWGQRSCLQKWDNLWVNRAISF